MPQNLLSIGFDIERLKIEKAQVLELVQETYAQLNAYNNSGKAPINITGLTQLTQSVQAQADAFNKLTPILSESMIALQQYQKMAQETANINGKIAASYTDEAKANAASKVELQERTRLLKEEAREENQLYQTRKQADEQLKQQAQQRKQIQAQQQEQLRLQAQQARQAAAIQAEKDKQAAREGKAILAQNDLYERLLYKRKDIETRFVNSIYNYGSKDPRTVGLSKELSEVNGIIRNIDRELERAGSSGATIFARTLTEGLSTLRTIAYVLPGIGIAGIFNLAFEAIEGASDALGLFNNKLQQSIEYEKSLADNMSKANEILIHQAQLYNETFKSDTDYYGRLNDLSSATGDSYEKRFADIDKFNTARKNQAEENLKSLSEEYSATGDINKVYKEKAEITSKLLTLDDQRAKANEKLKNIEEELKKTQDKSVFDDTEGLNVGGKIVTTGVNAIKKFGETSGLKDLQETFKSELEKYDKQISALSGKRDAISKALDERTSADTAIQEEAAKRAKYLADEERKAVLSDANEDVNITLAKNQKILSNELSTQKQRLEALSKIKEAREKIASAELSNIVGNNSSSNADIAIATKKFNSELQKIDLDYKAGVYATESKFWKDITDLMQDAMQTEIQIQENASKKIYSDENKSYEDRIKALTSFVSNRAFEINNEYLRQVDINKKTLPADLVDEANDVAAKKRNKDLQELNNQQQADIYNITKSWVTKQIALTQELQDKTNDITVKGETEALKILNDKYDEGLISFARYQKEKQKIEHEFKLKGDRETIQRDTQFLEQLQNLASSLDIQIKSETDTFENADNEKDAEDSQKRLQALIEGRKQVGKQINEQQAKVDADNNKEQKDHLDDVERAHKLYAAKVAEVYNSLFDTINRIVDSSYEYQIDKIKEQADAFDESIDKQLEAIERSTIASKDKNAYEIKLQAEKTAADKEAAKEQKKIEHDKAVFERDLAIAQIILNTEIAVTSSLKIPGAGIGLAIATGAAGALALAKAAATKIPSYAEGGVHKEDGLALFGEAGREVVKQPGKPPYIADKPTLAHLPAGTELIPLYKIPSFDGKPDNSWAQTLYLGKQIAKNNKQIKNVFKPKIIVDLGRNNYINRILGQ